MSLFLDAAKKWNEIKVCSYHIVLGKKGKMEEFTLRFRMEDFDHLSGMQYANDVDFKLPRNKYRGINLVPALIDGKMDDTLIEKSMQWGKISERLELIIDLEEVLDADFVIYKFNPRKLPFHSEIKAAFCIYSEKQGKGVFLFVDTGDECCYCKSIFSRDDIRDYRSGQEKWTILRKSKYIDGNEVALYEHRAYKKE